MFKAVDGKVRSTCAETTQTKYRAGAADEKSIPRCPIPDFEDPTSGKIQTVELKVVNKKVPFMLGDAQISRTHGRAASIHHVMYLVNKIRTNLAMQANTLTAQVLILNLQHAREVLRTSGARRRMELEYQDWTRVQAAGPHTGGYRDHRVGRQSYLCQTDDR